MDTFPVTVTAHEPAAASRSWLLWLGLLSVILSGCASGRPWELQIQGGRGVVPWQAGGADSDGLKVTTFNVWGLPSWINGASPERYDQIAQELARLESDVVLLQEVWTRRSFDALSERAKGAERTWWVACARQKGGFFGQNGLLTLSKYPIEGGQFRPFGAACLPDSLMNKGALKVTIRIQPKRKVNIWNVHLQAWAAERVRSRQVAELVRWIQEAEDGQIVDIVCGDFNFTPDSGDFLKFTAAVGPSVHQLAHEVALPTWDGLKSEALAGQALDHIFVRTRRPGEEIRAWPWRIFTATRLEDRLSDHMGVEAILSFRGAGENEPAPLVLRTSAPAPPEPSTLLRQ